jgi:hypothetical protein
MGPGASTSSRTISSNERIANWELKNNQKIWLCNILCYIWQTQKKSPAPSIWYSSHFLWILFQPEYCVEKNSIYMSNTILNLYIIPGLEKIIYFFWWLQTAVT